MIANKHVVLVVIRNGDSDTRTSVTVEGELPEDRETLLQLLASMIKVTHGEEAELIDFIPPDGINNN